MKHFKLLTFFVVIIGTVNCDKTSEEENEAKKLVQEINAQQLIESNKVSEARWNYESDMTSEHEKIQKKALEKYAEFSKRTSIKLKGFDYENFHNETLKRMIKRMSDIGDSILKPKDFSALKDAIMQMKTIYAKTKIPSFTDKNVMFSLEPEITNILEESRDPEELKYYWKSWFDLTGRPNMNNFWKYVELRNLASQENGFSSGAESWLDAYEDPTFEEQCEKILSQIEPLFLQLHGYVRYKLYEQYGPEVVDLKKPIPIHLLGNLWGQKWTIGDIVTPYNTKQKVDVTEEMINQKYTPRKMFETSEKFFLSLNLPQMPESFWKKSIFEKPKDGRDMVCHASAWDFAINNDVRIKQCTRVTMESFVTIHHEMGHVEYYLHYNKQPMAFRGGANPGFHEAIGDVIALSVSTTKHLQRIDLLHDYAPDPESEMNQIIRLGLEKLAFLPFAFVMDKFRWEVFRGNVKPRDANCYFWKLREQYGGVEPAVVRTNRDFDITAKYHASADVEYLRYFVSFIIQFQFHKALCTKAGEYEPNNPNKTLNDCDIYQSAEAGELLKSMLTMGTSKPWPDAMEVMTGQRQLDASALLEYFKPMEEWLLKTNQELGVQIGWEASDSEKAFDKISSHEDYILARFFQKSIAQLEALKWKTTFEKITFPM